MPFRKNLFGDSIAQPGTEFAEIDEVMLERHGIAGAEISFADIYGSDDDYKFGGELFLFGQNIEADEGEDDPQEASMNFDGFESIEDARAWLDSLGCTTINEVG